MANSPDFKDYTLPGDIEDPRHATRRAVSMATAYSRFINPRGLESPFYGPWNNILCSLIDDADEALSVFPQLMIYRLRRERRPSDAYSTSSKASKAEGNTDQAIPDFCIVSVVCTHREGQQIPPLPTSWSLLQIPRTDIRAIVELKQAPSRNLKTESRFVISLDSQLLLAKVQLRSQAALVFASPTYRNRDVVLCIAVSGEWYSWRLFQRTEFNFPEKIPKNFFYLQKYATGTASESPLAAGAQTSEGKNDEGVGEQDRDKKDSEEDVENRKDEDVDDNDDDVDSDEAEDEIEGEQGDGENEADEEDKKESVDAVLPGVRPVQRFEGLSHPILQAEVANIVDAWPERGDWSGWIRLGTAASNQSFYLMNQFLRDLQYGR
ncbi:hypothetical protein CVT25_008564 [Psilocybe cyanescens]|uniref:Uncharacterized protein n=1 Tax=Psilocybe cyanescens TaxID=93625 RepID=A0A409XRW6_PSICY|nr:hypothetical protein CVT25_008564 [Psilocybe cyanescens]